MLCLRLFDFLRSEAGPKVTQLDSAGVLRYHDVVGLQVCVNQTATVQEAQRNKELSSVQDHPIKTEANVTSKFV